MASVDRMDLCTSAHDIAAWEARNQCLLTCRRLTGLAAATRHTRGVVRADCTRMERDAEKLPGAVESAAASISDTGSLVHWIPCSRASKGHNNVVARCERTLVVHQRA